MSMLMLGFLGHFFSYALHLWCAIQWYTLWNPDRDVQLIINKFNSQRDKIDFVQSKQPCDLQPPILFSPNSPVICSLPFCSVQTPLWSSASHFVQSKQPCDLQPPILFIIIFYSIVETLALQFISITWSHKSCSID